MQYDIKRIWEGESCYIIGGGDSVKNLKPDSIRDENIIVVNNAYKIFPEAAFCIFMDKEWWDIHSDTVKIFKGDLISVHHSFKDHPKIGFVNRGTTYGLSQDAVLLRTGNNSGHIALNFACFLGVSTIYLVGFDMKTVNGRHNYHDEHKRVMPDNIYSTMYIKAMESIGPDLRSMGVEVINVTPGSALKCFPFAEDIMERIHVS